MDNGMQADAAAGAPAQRPGAGAARPHTDSVQFLVFELQGQRYGVDVAGIDAIVQAPGLRQPDGTYAYEGEGMAAVHALDHWVGLASGREAPAEDTPRHLLLSRSGGKLYGLLVGMPRDIVSLPLEAIYALPPLIRRLLPDSPLWGVGRAEDGLILLVDPANRGRQSEAPAPGTMREAEAEL